MIIGGSRSRKTNALVNLIKEQHHIDKIYLWAKDLSEPKYEFLIKKHEDAGTKHLNDLSKFIECSNSMDDVYENIDDYNPNRQRKSSREYSEKMKAKCMNADMRKSFFR